MRTDEVELPENKTLSYKMPERPQVADPSGTKPEKPQLEPAAVIPTAPATAAPVVVHVPVPAAASPLPSAPPARARLLAASRLSIHRQGSGTRRRSEARPKEARR